MKRPVQLEPRKGYKDERCNRTDCDSGSPAVHQHRYNSKDASMGDLAWYCDPCAREIARMCAGDGFQLFDFMPKEEKRRAAE